MNTRKSDIEDPSASETAEDSSLEGAGPDAATDLPIDEQLQAAKAERDANYDRFLRTQAEFENYRKRVHKETEENSRYEAIAFVRELLPALDNLSRAIAAADGTDKEELVRGVEMVATQFDAILASRSVVAIDAMGKPFDPNLHEAVQQIPNAEHPPMTVLEEIERGYLLHDRVVRPSKVIVSAEPAAPSEAPDEQS